MGPTSMHVNSVQLVPNFQNKVFQKTQQLKGSLVQTVSSSVVSKTLNPVISGTVNLDVSYPVVNLAPTVHSRGPPHKKGVSPGQSQNKINHVKGVCCVIPCFSAPHILTVPNAVSRQNVGGRLQNFWQVWQKMGESGVTSGVSSERRLFPSLQAETHLDKVFRWFKVVTQIPTKAGF